MIDEESTYNDSSQNNHFSRKFSSVQLKNSIRIPQKQHIEIQDDDSGSDSKKLCLEKEKPIEHTLLVRLENILRGTTKHTKITRNVLDSSGCIVQEDKNFSVKIKSGMAIGKRITFPGEGNHKVGYAQGDVVFIIKDKPHTRFKVINQVDIEYTAKITAEESKSGCELSIPTLENDPILLTIEEEIDKEMVEKISGRGLFYANNLKKRGCLIIRFEICEHKPEEELATEVDDNDSDDYGIEMIDEPVNKENATKLNQKSSQKHHQEQSTPSKTHKKASLPQDPLVEHDLMLTLEQILKGCKKKLQINRIVLEPDGESETFEDKVVVIEIKPGTEEGTRFTFPREGDQNPGTIPADVVFIVRDKPHDIFKRYGPHIEYTASITQKQFLNGVKITIPTLEKENLEFSLEELSKPNAVKRFYRRGLPYANDANKRGDLIVRFEVNKHADTDTAQESEMLHPTLEIIQESPIEHDLFLSLEQIINGCTKKMLIKDMIVDGKERSEDKILQIKVQPGTSIGSQITFPRESDQRQGIIPADVVFTIKDKSHDVFKRNGFDIEYMANVSGQDCANGNKIHIPTLGKENVTLTLDEKIIKSKVIQIADQGLPIQNDVTKRGNLVVRLNVIKDTSNDVSESLQQNVIEKKREEWDSWEQQGQQMSNNKEIETTAKQNKGEITKIRKDDDQIRKMHKNQIKVIENQQQEISQPKQFQQSQHENSEMQEQVIQNRKQSGQFEPNVNHKIVLNQQEISQQIQLEQRKNLKNGQSQDRLFNQPNKSSQLEQTQPKLFDQSLSQLQTESILRDLPLTLKEILLGGDIIKKFPIRIFESDGMFKEKFVPFLFKVRPGTLPGKRYTFLKAGDQFHGQIPADVVFITSDKEHPYFRREASNVVYTALITQNEAKHGVQLEIPTLDGEPMKITLKGPAKHGTEQNYEHRGLPDPTNPQERGYLIVRFEIVDDEFKDPLMQREIKLTLKQILTGCRKTLDYEHTFFDLEGSKCTINKFLPISINPGIETDVTFYYQRFGSVTNPRRIPADLEITIREEKHPNFTRKGKDIEYIAKLRQNDLRQGKVMIPTIENEFELQIGNKILKRPLRRIPGFGLPDGTGKRGDLVIQFEFVENGTVKEYDNEIKPPQRQCDLPDEMTYNISLTLEEIITGAPKQVSLDGPCRDKTGRIMRINVHPGSVAGTTLYYRVKDFPVLKIITREKPHQHFIRKGLDILYDANISLTEALCGGKVEIPKLEKILFIHLVKIIQPNKSRKIQNRGIPDKNTPNRRGNLIVFWKIRFPSELSKENKLELYQIFKKVFEKYPKNRDKIKIIDELSENPHIRPQDESNRAIQMTNQNPPIEHAVSLSLTDILKGTSSRYQVERTVMDSNENKKRDLKVLNVILNPGQMEAIFPRQGNHHPGTTPSDVIFRVIDEPHSVFKRVNQVDIQCTAVITLQEALCGFNLRVPTLEMNPIDLTFGLNDEKVISLEDKHTIRGLGLPYPNNPCKRGNLIVKFELIFPSELSKDQKIKIMRILNM